MAKSIELDAPNLSEVEKEYLCRCIDLGFVSTYGPFVPQFEDEFAKFIGIKGAVSLQSGTAAIHIALYELGVGQQDEVIVPALTFAATVNPVIYLRARPVFVDVDIKTWNISPEDIEKRITKRTKAIIAVHLYGNSCNMEKILNIAKRYNLSVIEDATESLGSKYKDRYTGTFADYGCFSFNGNKIITTGGGGMVVGNSLKHLEHIRFLVNQARSEANGYYHPEVGFNYRMTNIEAALGLAQMKKLNEFVAKKKRLNQIYREELKSIKFIRFQEEHEGVETCWWLSAIVFDKEINITALQKELKSKGIPTRRIFMPLVKLPPYKKYKQGDYKNSYRIYEKGLCLPSSTLNSEDDIYYVCKRLNDLI